MNTTKPKIIFAETPDEVSLSFCVYGCPFRCEGCHSPELRNPHDGIFLSPEVFEFYLTKYEKYVSCVLFMGGEYSKDIVNYLSLAHKHNLKTCLYTGMDVLTNAFKDEILPHLDYLKYGSYKRNFGPLTDRTTNQRYIKVDGWKDLTYKFYEKIT